MTAVGVHSAPGTPTAPKSTMDTLLANIDAEGLTASTLQESLTKLEIRRNETILALLKRSSQIYSAKIDTSTPTEDLIEEAAYSSSLATLHSRGLATSEPLSKIASLASQHAEIATKLQETLKSTIEVGAVAQLQKSLAEYDGFVTHGMYQKAATAILELENAINTVSSMEDSSSHVQERLIMLKQYLASAPQQYLTFDPSTHLPSLHHPPQQTAALFLEVWKAADNLGVLQDSLNSLSTALVQYCIKPLLAAEIVQQQQQPHMTSGAMNPIENSPAYSIASSSLSMATTAARNTKDITTERSIYKCLKFICESIFARDTRLIHRFGSSFWDTASAVYITSKLHPVKPHTEADLDIFIRIGTLGAKIEEKATKLGLLPEKSEGPIARYVRHSVSKVLGDKRTRYVAVARDMLIGTPLAPSVSSVSANKETIRIEKDRFQPANKSLSFRALAFDSLVVESASTDPTSAGTQTNDTNTMNTAATNNNNKKENATATATTGGMYVEAALKEIDDAKSIYDIGPYLVTKGVDGVASLMNSVLADACRPGRSATCAVAHAACAAVIDMAALVVALWTTDVDVQGRAGKKKGNGGQQYHHAEEEEEEVGMHTVGNIPYLAALRYTDCMHIYLTLCMLPHAHSPRLQLLVHKNINFAAPALRVRIAGEESLSSMLSIQKKELLAISHDILSWGEELDDTEVKRRKKGMQQIVHSCSRLSAVLYGVLPRHAYIESMASVMNSVAEYMSGDIIAQRDIAEDESRLVPHVLQPMIMLYTNNNDTSNNDSNNNDSSSGEVGLVRSVVNAAIDSTSISTPPNDEKDREKDFLRRDLVASAAQLVRLKEVCEILEIPSKEIAKRWVSGRLSNAGVKKEEVLKMVEALFEDNQYRQRSIGMIMKN